MPNPWPNCPRLSRGPAAVLAALHLGDPRADALGELNDREWREALDFCDRSQLTLIIRSLAREAMPPWARERTDQDAAKNLLRLISIEEQYRRLAGQLSREGIEFLALKGLTHCPLFGTQPENRVQYDIDLFSPRKSVHRARDILLAGGFEPLEGMEEFPTDHLPTLVRKTGWQWRGDYFDPEIPISVELHFQFWDERLERLRAPGVEAFWDRRVTRPIARAEIPALCSPDAAGYAALHLLRHVLRGNVRAFHAHELARFLDSHARDAPLWDEWRSWHAPELRRIEAVGFRFAEAWFGCAMAPVVRRETDQLPAATRQWFEEFATAPVSHSNKDELWLHLSLLESRRDRWSVARRRLLPGRLPGPVDANYIPESQMSWRRRALKNVRYAAYLASRLRYHGVALPRTAMSGAGWWWKTNGLGRQFWIFLSAAVLFNFGLFIFVLLYNLYLLDLGFREDFLGVLSGSSTAGMVAGTLPAAFLIRRFGLRNSLLAIFAGSAGMMALRALVTARAPLVGLAFVYGVIFSVYAVAMAPAIAGAVEENRRPAAFSVFFATMFALGIGGGWVGGRLPLWVHGKQAALLIAAALAASAIWPAWRLRPKPLEREGARVYPRGQFLPRFLAGFALWHLATGSFNPFFNAYFARLRVPVERIGTIFSVSQLVQVISVLLAPLVFRRFGLVTGIVSMMLAAALGLGSLAAQPAAGAAALAYTAYMAFQWMSEPGLNTLLMNQVEERERSGASALYYLVAFSAQALAAFAAGALLARWGYGPVLAGAAVLAGVAAVLFRVLVRQVEPARREG